MVVLVQAVVWTRLHAASQTSDNVRLSNNQQSKHVRIVLDKNLNLELGKCTHTLSSSPSISTFPLSLSRPAARLCADSTSDISTTGSCAVAKTWAEQQCLNVLTPLCCLQWLRLSAKICYGTCFYCLLFHSLCLHASHSLRERLKDGE